MKKFFFIFIGSLLFSLTGMSQKKTYYTSAFETIFSFANIDYKGTNPNSTIRWAPVFNLQTLVNSDINNKVGFFSGLAIRNVGYIFDGYHPTTGPMATYKKKFRSYNLAVPVGMKFGNMDKTFFYAGYEVELPILYKEKTFEGGDKIDKITGWFSNRQELFQHGFLAGVQFPYGVNLKFKYYISEFHNQDYTDGSGNKPYAGLKSNIYYFSLSTFIFRNFKYDEGGAHK